MTDETENLILHLLRDIGGEVAEIKQTVSKHSVRLEGIDRRLGDLNESVALAMGMAGQSHISQESLGQRIDEMRVDLDHMKERVDEMERPS